MSFMSFSAVDLTTIALIMTFGSVVQGAVGFASGLLSVPSLVLCGFSLLEATVINFVSTSVQNAAGAVQLWSHLEPAELVWPVLLRCAGLPLGIYALAESQSLQPGAVRQIVGAILLAAVVLLNGFQMRPRNRINAFWSAATFLTSGFLMGFATLGGAPMVLYVNSLSWSASKSRGFLFFCSAALVPPAAALFTWKFGAEAAPPALAALAVMPAVLAGLWIGLNLGHRLDKGRFRRVTYGLLTLIAISALVSPLLLENG